MFNRLVDLSHPIHEGMTVYPGTASPLIDFAHTVARDGFAELNLSTVLHVGTHIDAPSHILEGGRTLDTYPVDQFMGQAVVVPCIGLEEIQVVHLLPYEQQIQAAEFVLFYTGWQDRWNTPQYQENSPVPTQEAVRWLVSKGLKGVGVDAFSLDLIISAELVGDNLPNHPLFLANDVLLLENLTHLDQLPVGALFTFMCMPIKIKDADGSPVRAVALL